MNNIFIKCLTSEKIQSGVCHGQFMINSLKPGQGITIGNQLRREKKRKRKENKNKEEKLKKTPLCKPKEIQCITYPTP